MTNPGPASRFTWNEKFAIVVTHTIVVFMAFCISFVLRDILLRFQPGWKLGYFPVILVIVAIEALFSLRRTKLGHQAIVSTATYRISEWLLLFVSLRLFFYLKDALVILLANGTDGQANLDLNPSSLFGHPEFVSVLVCAILVYLFTTLGGEFLIALEGDAEILATEWSESNRSDRGQDFRSLATLLFTVGVFLILIMVITQSDIRGLPPLKPPVMYVRLGIMGYFMSSLLLLTQGNLAVLRASWSWLRIPIADKINRQWLGVGLMFVIVIGIVVSVFPSNYSYGPISTISLLIGYLVYFLTFVFLILMFVPVLLISAINPDIPLAEPPEMPQIFPSEFFSSETAQQVIDAPPFWEVLRSSFFWIVFVGLFMYAIVQYARQNEAFMKMLRNIPGTDVLMDFWDFIANLFSRFGRQVREIAADGRKRLAALRRQEGGLTRPWRYFQVNRMSPREKIQFFYLSLIARAEKFGIPRSPSQTPGEYTAQLHSAVNYPDDTLEALTEQFEEARYSSHLIELEDADRAKQRWQEVSQVFRKKGGDKPPGG